MHVRFQYEGCQVKADSTIRINCGTNTYDIDMLETNRCCIVDKSGSMSDACYINYNE